MDRESALHDVLLEARSLLKHSADFDLSDDLFYRDQSVLARTTSLDTAA